MVKIRMFEEMTFTEVIEHLSSVYMDTEHSCDVCRKAEEVLNKHKFMWLRKTWDYDD